MPTKFFINCPETCEMDDSLENKNTCCFQCKNKDTCDNPCKKESCFEKEKEKLEAKNFVFDIKIFCHNGIIVTVKDCDENEVEGFKKWFRNAELKGVFSVTRDDEVRLILKQNIITVDITKHF